MKELILKQIQSFASIILLIGIISFVPVASLIFNLTRDYHEQTILVKEGYIDRTMMKYI